LIEALGHRLAGNEARAEEVLSQLPIGGADRVVDAWWSFRQGVNEVLQQGRNTVVERVFGRRSLLQNPLISTLTGHIEGVIRGKIDSSPPPLLRVPPCLSAAFTQGFLTRLISSAFNTETMHATIAELRERAPLQLLRAGAALISLAEGRVSDALREYDTFRAARTDLFDDPESLRVIWVATLASRVKDDDRALPRDPSLRKQLGDDARALLRDDVELSARELNLLGHVAAHVEDRWLAAECAARLMQLRTVRTPAINHATDILVQCDADLILEELLDDVLRSSPGNDGLFRFRHQYLEDRHQLAEVETTELPSECPTLTTTASGLEYCMLREGDGPSPAPSDRVSMHYGAWYLDPEPVLAESSAQRGGATYALVDRLVRGWAEGVQLMRPGARYKFVLSPKLQLGKNALVGVPSGKTVILEVELLDVIPAPVLPPSIDGRAKRTESGVTWELAEEGSGPPSGPDDGLALRFAVWDARSELLHSSVTTEHAALLRGDADGLPHPFLRELHTGRRLGDVLRVELPDGSVPGLRGATTWRLDVIDITPMPSFRRPNPALSQRSPKGCSWEALTAGDGPIPGPKDRVRVHHQTWLTDGTPCFGTYSRAEAEVLRVNEVIPGWSEALRAMPVGSTWLVELPARRAYGKLGAGSRSRRTRTWSCGSSSSNASRIDVG
jgi:FKBP-type peptidyl-prolyl cis-trans isomerase